ncbi:MAG: hypothetical protein HY606_02370 [Planctomycetes bacterium]|nr:hypothetical protein [Planctomycetota bacterium]
MSELTFLIMIFFGEENGFFKNKKLDFWKADGQSATKHNTATNQLNKEHLNILKMTNDEINQPIPVTKLLENPTEENAMIYLNWQKRRIESIRKATEILNKTVQKVESERRKKYTSNQSRQDSNRQIKIIR